jgi:hypothetical protein
LIPELGYVPGNIAIISMRANLIKQRETSPDALRKIAAWIEENIQQGGSCASRAVRSSPQVD